MSYYHVIEAKRMGWGDGDEMYETYFFPTDEYSRESAIEQFSKVEKETRKGNNWYPYTAYEYDGETFYSIRYCGTCDESKAP